MRNPWLVVLALLVLVSCDYFKQDDPRTPIARVNKVYLYQEDIDELISKSTSVEDSTILVSNYINRWATQQLLIDRAKINLSDEELSNYNKLVEQYKIDLYTEAYKSSIVTQQLDSAVAPNELATYYELNKDNFKLNEDLVKVRYIHVDHDYVNLNGIKEKFRRFDNEDIEELNEVSIQFKSYNLNDSTWVKKLDLILDLPIVQEEQNQVLKKSNFTQLQDSLGVYLVKIEDVLNRNDIAPLSFVAPTIEQIILNKRKLELIINLEKDITKDAIKDKKFETYTHE